MEQFQAGLVDNRASRGGVAVSVCSAYPDIWRAAFRAARRYRTFALIESTASQVNPYGGYSGMTPADFAGQVHRVAAEERFPRDLVLLGGDHLGPQPWRTMPSAAALDEARRLVAACVVAGYRKLHLDASFVCRDDRGPLSEEIVATRCAELAKVCEAQGRDDPPLYIVGTEVPEPGGMVDGEQPCITSATQVKATLDVFEKVFRRYGLEGAWERVVGLVVRPGVEFGDDGIRGFTPDSRLAAAILNHEGMVYEAHSTDYQGSRTLRALVQHHFYILKVGPWLTYTLREGLYGLERMEKALDPPQPSHFRRTLVQAMQRDPRHWRAYYRGTPTEIEQKFHHSHSDRARYYLGCADVAAARERLMANLHHRLSAERVERFMPRRPALRLSGGPETDPRDLVVDRVAAILELYLAAGRNFT